MADLLARLRAALIGRYTIERELGRGGMATVYLSRDLKHHRAVALKVLRPELAAALGPERFVREIELAAGLTHPHILPLHDSGVYAGLGDKDQALDWLQRAYEERSSLLVFALREPRLAPLRTEPRFAALMREFAPPQ